MQSGTAKTKSWVLDFEEASPKGIEPLMGWTSSSDTRQQVRLRFDTKDEAIAYCEHNGIPYQVFDPTLRRPEPYRYAGTATTNGMTSYRFAEQVTNQQVAEQTLPGRLVGLPGQPSVTLPEYLTETNTYWVDPATGAPLSVTENQTLSLEDTTGATKLILFKGVLASTPASVTEVANKAGSSHLKIELIQDVGPLVALLLGIIMLVVGITLTIGRPGDDEFAYETDEPVGSTF